MLSEREIVTLAAETYKRKPVIKLPPEDPTRPLDYYSDSLEIIPDELRLGYLVYCQRRMYDLFIRENSRIEAIEHSEVAFQKYRIEKIVRHEHFQTPKGQERFRYLVNTKWLAYPRWIIMESLLSEVLSTYQHTLNPEKTSLHTNPKDKQLTELAEKTGLHIQITTGNHMQPGEGLFAALMQDLQIPAPPDVIVPAQDKKHNWWDKVHGKIKGSSTLILYTAPNCTRPAICKLRGGKDDFEFACLKCGSILLPQS